MTASDGTPFSQSSRNRGIARAIGHAEYGLTPDTGVFGELVYTNTSYRNELFPGIPNRSSNQVQALAGLSTDLSELLRGSIGVGYINRKYEAARYRTVAGLSFNGKIEYFPSQLTTVTLSGRREVDDASLIGTSGFFATNAALRIDHELLRNLLVNIGADLEFDDYRDFSGRATSFRTSAGGQYLVNHQLSINGQLFYGRRTTNSPLAGPELSQAKALIGISYHPEPRSIRGHFMDVTAHTGLPSPTGGEPETLSSMYRQVLEILRLRWRTLAATFVTIAVLGTAYTMMLTPRYQATARVKIDPSKSAALGQITDAASSIPDQSVVETEVSVMRSHDIAAAVVAREHLLNDPEFTKGMPPLGARATPAQIADRTEAVAQAVLGRMSASREKATYIVEVGFTSTNPAKAARDRQRLCGNLYRRQPDAP